MLQKGRGQDVPKLTNVFHILRMKLGMKDSEWNLVLNYRGYLHKYIQDKIEFLDISSLRVTYQYAVKIEYKFKQNKWDFGSTILKQGQGAPKP